jgi:NADPH:quinone reductase-like Zn-dependent oxidoreductase
MSAIERTNEELAAAVQAAGRRFTGISVEPDQVGLEALAELVDTGRLRPHVEHALPLAEAAAAHALLDTGLRGKVVLTVPQS